MLKTEAVVSVESTEPVTAVITPTAEKEGTDLELSGEFKNLNRHQIDLLRSFADLSCKKEGKDEREENI